MITLSHLQFIAIVVGVAVTASFLTRWKMGLFKPSRPSPDVRTYAYDDMARVALMAKLREDFAWLDDEEGALEARANRALGDPDYLSDNDVADINRSTT